MSRGSATLALSGMLDAIATELAVRPFRERGGAVVDGGWPALAGAGVEVEGPPPFGADTIRRRWTNVRLVQ